MLQNFQKRLQAQPFTELIQATLTQVGDDSCELTIPIRDELKQQHGFLHGGVVSYAADNALTIAGAISLGKAVVTSEFKINYVRPAIGHAIVARAQCIHAGKTQAVCRCEIYAITEAGEKLCAVAQGTIALLSSPAK
ncbi:PaaI family thioesterase [Alcaligenaceae bacterium]|nr:PaaI family thioesterase [Alcaligenaceae bacterium]